MHLSPPMGLSAAFHFVSFSIHILKIWVGSYGHFPNGTSTKSDFLSLDVTFISLSENQTNKVIELKTSLKKVEYMSESAGSLSTIRTICEKKEAIPILRCLDHACEPLKLSEIEEISGVSYDKCISICYRLVDVGILSLHRTVFDRRLCFFEIKDEDAVKRIFDYDEKLKVKEAEQYASGKLSRKVEEV